MSESTIITPRLLKTRDAARYLSISAWKLRNLVQSGEMPCILGDGRSSWLFDTQDLNGWIEHRKRACKLGSRLNDLMPTRNAFPQARCVRIILGIAKVRWHSTEN